MELVQPHRWDKMCPGAPAPGVEEAGAKKKRQEESLKSKWRMFSAPHAAQTECVGVWGNSRRDDLQFCSHLNYRDALFSCIHIQTPNVCVNFIYTQSTMERFQINFKSKGQRDILQFHSYFYPKEDMVQCHLQPVSKGDILLLQMALPTFIQNAMEFS